MRHVLEPIHCRPWQLNCLSLALVESHYENNYGGAVRKLNAVSEQLEALDMRTASPPLVGALKREQMAALNSTLLHELYFASMGGQGDTTPRSVETLSRDFGSFERWKDEFVAMAGALAGGSGWVVLTWVPRDGRLMNQYATDHSQSIAGGVPILALDMYEHAYHMDFGANAKAYIHAFFRNIDWQAVETRLEDARAVAPLRPLEQPEFAGIPAVSPEEVKGMIATGKPVQVIDVRPRHYALRTQDLMEGAVWRDPERVEEWIGELAKDEPVVVFCAYGFHVGCRTAGRLRDAGFDATFMKGGHVAWKAMGGATKQFAPA